MRSEKEQQAEVSVDNEPRILPDTPRGLMKALHRFMGEKHIAILRSIGALQEVESALLPVTTDDGDDLDHVMPVATWVDTDIEITLDSGCCEHVMDISDAPGYANSISESSGSKRNQHFIVGNGEKVPNEGVFALNMEASGQDDKLSNIRSVFQVAEVTRPLMSVGRVCDQGMTCLFTSKDAQILDKDGH